MHEIRTLDLFSGIGGFALGLKRAGGFRTVAYCEIEPYCIQVLQARMRDGSLDTAPICTDITKLDGKPWRGRVDLICGGFPCQDISNAGRREGIGGERSGLWKEMLRVICEVRPRIVFVENVSALLGRGLDVVLGDLAESGYDAEWDCIPAAAVGAPHRRNRIWIVAYPMCNGGGIQQESRRRGGYKAIFGDDGQEEFMAYARSERRGTRTAKEPDSLRMSEGGKASLYPERCSWWATEPNVGRVAHGVPRRVDRLRGLGNAVVPQVVEFIGRRIRESLG